MNDERLKLSRRTFLQGLAATAAGLYVPTKTIFLPPRGGWPVFNDIEVFGSDLGKPLGGVSVASVRGPDAALLSEKALQKLLEDVWAAGGDPQTIFASEHVIRALKEHIDVAMFAAETDPDHGIEGIDTDIYVTGLGAFPLLDSRLKPRG